MNISVAMALAVMRYVIMQYEPRNPHHKDMFMTDRIEQKTIGYRKDYT